MAEKRSAINHQLLMWMTNGSRLCLEGLSLKPKNENKQYGWVSLSTQYWKLKFNVFGQFQSIVWIVKPATNQVPEVFCLVWSVRGDMVWWWMNPWKNLQLKFKPVFIPTTKIKRFKKHKNIQHEKSFWLTTCGKAGSVRGRPPGQAEWVWWMLSTCSTHKSNNNNNNVKLLMILNYNLGKYDGKRKICRCAGVNLHCVDKFVIKERTWRTQSVTLTLSDFDVWP